MKINPGNIFAKMTEEWRDIPGYPGYKASSLGNIRGIYGKRNIGSISKYGNCQYLMVSLNTDKKHRMLLSHRLIALAFHGPPPDDKPICDHINRNKLDNRPENLHWVDKADNCANQDSMKHSKTGIKGLCLNRGFWQPCITRRGILYKASFPERNKQEAIDWLRDKRLELAIPK